MVKLAKLKVIPCARAHLGDEKQVTETVWTLKDSFGPSGGKTVLLPIFFRLYYDNPTGSGCTLDMDLRCYLSDGTEESNYLETPIPAGVSNFRDVNLLTQKDDVKRLEVRLYGRVNVAPAAGKEPVIQLLDVGCYQL